MGHPVTITIEEIQALAKTKEGKCLSSSYLGPKIKLRWECKEGHQWSALYSHIKYKNCWCALCRNNALMSDIGKCKDAAARMGGECLSTEYAGQLNRLRWRCKEGHEWLATPKDIFRNHWCPECFREKLRCSIEDCKTFAINHNGFCLSEKYINTISNLSWQCEFGHTWSASFNKVRNGIWCPVCYDGKRQAVILECKQVAEERGGKCISDEYVRIFDDLEWECAKGHRWSACFDRVKNGGWCPQCKIKKIQKLVQKIVANIFTGTDVYFNYRNFDWLKTNKSGKQELDIYVPEIKLAIEYDGEQHFGPVNFGGISDECALRNFEYIKRLDALKNTKVAQHPEDVKYFLRFNYKEKKLLTEEYVKEKLITAGVPIGGVNG